MSKDCAIKLEFPSGTGAAKLLGRSFIAMALVVGITFIWYAIRDRCSNFTDGSAVGWLQLLISWLVIALVLAVQRPGNYKSVVGYTLVVGILIGAVSIPCQEEGNFGDYILDILQGMTICFGAGSLTYLISKPAKLY